MTRRERTWSWVAGLLALAVAGAVFVVPFVFIFLTASKSTQESLQLSFSLPQHWSIWSNMTSVLKYNDFMILRAYKNSLLLTLCSVTLLVVLSSMAAWIIDRRPGKVAKLANALVLAGLMMPPAVVPTIFLLQHFHIYGTFPSMVLIEVAFSTSFTVMLFRAFIASIPRELDEAAIIDGATPSQLYFRVIFPLLRSVIVTSVILNSVAIFNDFVNPLYFLNGPGQETVQLTLFNFNSQYQTTNNLLFMDILLITIPMVVMFAVSNRRIVAGMTAGAVKG